MSDTHAWPPGSQADAVAREFAALRDRLRDLVGRCQPDDPRRAAVEAAALLMEGTEQQVQRILAAPVSARASVPVPTGARRRRTIGEHTRRGLLRLAGNRGRQ